MPPLASPETVPLPAHWSDDTKTAFLCAISLAHRAMIVVHSWCLNSRIARVRLVTENDRLRTENALLRELLRIKDSRMLRLPAESRPHYPPIERLAILAVKAAQGWSNAQTARTFLVTDATIARWLKCLDDVGHDALVALPKPVNRFPDLVALLVQQLKADCPHMGKQRIADTLACAGLHLSASTAGRMLKKVLPHAAPDDDRPHELNSTNTCCGDTAAEPPPASASGQIPKRLVTAKRPGHVWHVDLTAVPSFLGFWVPWFPYSWSQHWPFCFWVLLVVDHFSRKFIMLRSFRGSPTAAQVTNTLDIAIACAGAAPKYIVSDQGTQFRQDYRDWCDLCGIEPRFGAIGQHGSIAVVERAIRTLKQECIRRISVPLGLAAFEQEMLTYALWYNEHRPHQTLLGRTPNEVHEGRVPARDGPRIEMRPGLASKQAPADKAKSVALTAPRLRLVVMHFESRRHLPIIELRRVA